MIVFKYQVSSIEECHRILSSMEIPGSLYESEELDTDGSKIVFKGEKFVAIYHPESTQMELYGTKSTNSINYYINRFDKLHWDTWQCVRMKRW